MGEAKIRGTFEERKAAAIQRNRELRQIEKQEQIAKLESMTPEEIEIKKRQEAKMSQIMAMIYGMGGEPFLYRI